MSTSNCIITQREVGVDTDSWEAALKNTLRQAPDVILIGEIRDRETMEHAIAFAETGHLCMGTLHANNANQALDRIINFFPEERRPQLLMDLSLNLKAIVSQRLIPLKEGKGRAAAIEILLNSPLISDLIFKGEVHEIKEIMKKSRELGMQTFDQALFDLYEEGRISYEDALRNADSMNDLRLQIKLHGKESRRTWTATPASSTSISSELRYRLSRRSAQTNRAHGPPPHLRLKAGVTARFARLRREHREGKSRFLESGFPVRTALHRIARTRRAHVVPNRRRYRCRTAGIPAGR